MDRKALAQELGLDLRYLEERNVRGKTGFCWNNRHAKAHGINSEWLGYDIIRACQRADALNKSYDASKAGKPNAYPLGSLAWWTLELEKTKKHQRRGKVKYEVEMAFKRLRDTPLGNKPMKALKGSHIEAVHEQLVAELGVSLAQKTMKWARFAFNAAKREKHITVSPMEELRIELPDPRQVVVWEDEVKRLEDHFIAAGRPSLACAIRIAFDTGQRETDIIRFPVNRWIDKAMIIKQSKTGAVVRVDALPELVRAIGRVTKDREKHKFTSMTLLVNEETGRPWSPDNFSHRVNEGFRDLKLVDEDSGKTKVFRDLRRSAVVRLALAGCTTIEIGAVTGHSYARIEKILETYMPRLTGVAKNAIQRILDQRAALKKRR